MSWRRCPSLVAAGLLLAAAGCAAPRGVAAPGAEPVAERLANQARAIAQLSEENERLRRELEELRGENRRLRAAQEGKGPGTAPSAESRPVPPAGK